MGVLAERVLSRFLASELMVSPEYVGALLKAPGLSSNAPDAFYRLQQLAKGLQNNALDPFPARELWAYLEDRGVPQDEIDLLKGIRVLTPRKPKTLSFSDAFIQFGRETKTSVVPDMRFETDHQAPSAVLGWLAGYKKLKPKVKELWARTVKKVQLGGPVGTEDASWRPGGVLHLTINRNSDPQVRASQLTHELGHAFEELHHLQGEPWGMSPFVSEYAEFKPLIEDVAESYRAFIEEPAHLRGTCPEKFEILKHLV